MSTLAKDLCQIGRTHNSPHPQLMLNKSRMLIKSAQLKTMFLTKLVGREGSLKGRETTIGR